MDKNQIINDPMQEAFEQHIRSKGTVLNLETNAPSDPDIYVDGETAIAYDDFCAGWKAALATTNAPNDKGAAEPMTIEQNAALDLAILNLKTHGDDQLLRAVQPLIEFYETSNNGAEQAALATSASALARDEASVTNDTGNPEADRIIGRLMSADHEFDDCADAAAFIRRLVVEHRGPDGFATWKDAAIHERQMRVAQKLTDDLRDTLKLAIGYIGSSTRDDRQAHVARIRALLATSQAATTAGAQDERAALVKMANDMRAEQTFLGSCRETCDDSGRARWDRVQRVIDHLDRAASSATAPLKSDSDVQMESPKETMERLTRQFKQMSELERAVIGDFIKRAQSTNGEQS